MPYDIPSYPLLASFFSSCRHSDFDKIIRFNAINAITLLLDFFLLAYSINLYVSAKLTEDELRVLLRNVSWRPNSPLPGISGASQCQAKIIHFVQLKDVPTRSPAVAEGPRIRKLESLDYRVALFAFSYV